MNNTMVKSRSTQRLSIKAQALAALAAIVAAVALPQLFHVLGAVSGMGTIPGETFLPMHLPIILVGLLAGPFAGAAAGFMAPLVSFLMSGMPTAAMLPLMMIELMVYGLSSGFLMNTKMPTIGKVLVSQVLGRVVRAAAILFVVYVIGSNAVAVQTIWMSVVKGLPGLIMQWAFLPLIAYRVNNKKNEQ